MEYRLQRRRVAPRLVPAALAVAVLAGGGYAVLADRGADSSAAIDATAMVVADSTSPALIDLADGAATPAASPIAPPARSGGVTVPASTTTIPVAVPDTAPPADPGETLPDEPIEPIAPPNDPRAPEPLVTLGSISIPRLDVDAPLHEGIRLTTLDNGPGHWPGTAMPGEVGNVVVAAHRTSHGGPFRHIDQLVAGDTVEFTTHSGVSTYVVTGTQVVEPNAIWIVDPTDTPTATLFACHPPGSVSQRIVVNLELLP